MQPPDLCVHQETDMGKKPYSSDLCPNKFPHDSMLHAHQRAHTQEKPFCCEHCEKAFNHSGNLSGHTLGSSPTCAPSVTCLLSLGCLKSHQETHSEPLAQDSALGSKSFLLQEGNSQ